MTNIENFSIFPLFAIPIYSSFIDNLDSEKDYLSKVEYESLGLQNGLMTENKFLLDNKELSSLKLKIQQHIDFFLKTCLHLNENYKIEIKKSWGVKHLRGDRSHKHDHKNSIFSGVLYLKCDDDSGDIVFYKESHYCNLFPTMLIPNFKDYNMINSTEWRWTPKNNQIFLFPSHLTHSVTASKSDHERICLAFNVVVHGEYGNNNGLDSQGYLNL